MHISDTEILEMAYSSSIGVLISKQQLRWSGHLIRLPNERIPKQIFYRQLIDGKRLAHKPKKRFKDCLKQTFKKCDINSESWEIQTQNRLTWRKVIFKATGCFEESRQEHARLKCDLRKENITKHVTELTCGQCGRPCLSRAGFLSHLRSHRRRVSPAKHEKVISVYTTRQKFICPMPYSNICEICGKVCKSVGGMKRHKKVHISYPESSYIWQLWEGVQVLCRFEKLPPGQELLVKQWQYLKMSCCHHVCMYVCLVYVKPA